MHADRDAQRVEVLILRQEVSHREPLERLSPSDERQGSERTVGLRDGEAGEDDPFAEEGEPEDDQGDEADESKFVLDAKQRRIDLEIDEAELARRKAAWTAPPLRATRGTLYKYIKNVKSASEGCVTDE